MSCKFYKLSRPLKVLSSLDCNKAIKRDSDGVSSAVIKKCSKELTPFLVTFFNLNMEQSKVCTF